MPLVPGTRVGPYEVLALHGAGGMGEVYVGRDERLDRRVAIKVLSAPHATDKQLERFQREARAFSRVSHPNVCAIYDVGQQDGIAFLVMEFLEGETLAARLEKGPLPLDRALAIGAQMADALDAGHRQGVIHRDLTPGNVMLTTGGAKLLDFGLAKLRPEANPGAADTKSVGLTDEGMVFGTLPYMAPEQVEGLDADPRTDIFALGVMLYEMTTGQRPFQGRSRASLAAAILAQEPRPTSTPVSHATPAADRIIRKCLAKNPDDRWQSARDLASELRWVAEADPERQVGARGQRIGPGTRTAGDRRLRIAVGLLGTLLLAGLGAWLTPLLRRDPIPATEPVHRFSMELGHVRPVVSPNGRHIAYRLDGRLWIRDIDSETPREIPGGKATGGFNSDAAYYLTWSPDSRDLVFTTENELRRVSVLQGGSATTICALPPGRTTGRRIAGMAWSGDGETIVFSRYRAGIYEVPARGGSPRLLWKEDHADDVLLFDTPQGRAVVFAVSVAGGHSLVVRTPDGERREIAVIDTSWPELVYSPSGHVLYRLNPQESPSIWALPFSPRTLTTNGEPFLVERSGQGMSLARNGTLAYLDAGRIQGQRLAWRDRSGKILEQSGQVHQSIETVSLSPDGNRAIVVAPDGPNLAYWLYDLRRFVRTRLELGSESESATPMFASFSRSGDEIYYTLQKTRTQTIVLAGPADGFGQAHSVAAPEGFKVANDRTADGRYAVYVALEGGLDGSANANIWLWRHDGAGGNGEAINFSQTSANEGAVALSPNGRYVAYTSTIGGRVEVYVRPFPEGRGRWQVSVDGGEAPAWGPDGKELFFKEGNTLMRVIVSTSGQFSQGSPEALFDHPTLRLTPGPVARYAITPDGRRFLTVESERDRAISVVRFVQNWLAEFSRAAPRPAG